MIGRYLLCVLALAILGGCSLARNPLVDQVLPQLLDRVGGRTSGAEQAPSEPTRAQIDAIGSAVIAVRLGDGPRAFLVPRSDLDGYVIYQDINRRGLVLLGGLVTGTHGLGLNLAAVRHQIDDPLVTAAPIGTWPDTVNRDYQFWRGSGAARSYNIAVACRYVTVAREEIEIIERLYDTVRIDEICTNNRRSFTNRYWIAEGTTVLIKSLQWIGPKSEPVTVEILRRYSPAP